MSDSKYFLLIFLAMCLLLVFFLGRSPVHRTVETRIVGKRVRFQESITASGNAYVPVKSEVFTIDTEITYDARAAVAAAQIAPLREDDVVLQVRKSRVEAR